MLEARQENVVVQEWDSSCGAAALATILRFQLGDPVTERSVALGILRHTDPDRVRGRGGFSLLDLKRFAQTRGFAADGYAGLTAGQLIRIAPAIVPIRSYTGDHFVVFRGVVGGQAVLADPAFGNRSMPFSQFAGQWKDRLGFVVKPRARAGANRMLPGRRDLLRVEDEAARTAMDDALPRPLADWQLAHLFAIEASPQEPRLAVEASPGTGTAARNADASPLNVGSSADASRGPPNSSAGAGSATSSTPASGLSAVTTTVSTISPTATLPGVSVALPALPSISLPPIAVSVPISSPLAIPATSIPAPRIPPGH